MVEYFFGTKPKQKWQCNSKIESSGQTYTSFLLPLNLALYHQCFLKEYWFVAKVIYIIHKKM
jgi:hypothetical protein